MLLIIILKLLCVWNLKTKLLRARRDFMFVMNILSYNIRGCGSFLKRKRLVNLIRKEDFDMCLIQETEAKVIDDNRVVALQCNKDVKCSKKGAIRRSSGLLIMWKIGFLILPLLLLKWVGKGMSTTFLMCILLVLLI